VSKIVEALEAAHRSAQCEHKFEWVRERPADNSVVGYCPKCRCRYTAWPDTPHYQEILAAKAPSSSQSECGG
jgi:hypothetical protein